MRQFIRTLSSQRDIANFEEIVLRTLSDVMDPISKVDIVNKGMIKDLKIIPLENNTASLSFNFQLDTPAHPFKKSMKDNILKKLKTLPWIKYAPNITFTSITPYAQPANKAPLFPSLKNVGSIIAVSSCKGGVGKSTVAVNLAYSLASLGGRVGIFDSDIYGPSLPTMVGVEDHAATQNEKGLQPLTYEGVKLMSYGFVSKKGGAAVMRGPMVSNLVSQLLKDTEWGVLDYLVVDMPPGTGDIAITLCQVLPLSASVIVTTPQKLSIVDVKKGINMFGALKVPTISLVENMAHFDCDHGTRYFPFGQGSVKQLQQQYGIPNLHSLPLSNQPMVFGREDSINNTVRSTYEDIAKKVVEELITIKSYNWKTPSINYKEKDGGVVLRYFSEDSAQEFQVSNLKLRSSCKCAACIDEISGELKINFEKIPKNIHPVAIEPRGNYAVSVVWSDGHDSSIYPYDYIRNIAKQ